VEYVEVSGCVWRRKGKISSTIKPVVREIFVPGAGYEILIANKVCFK
jgi:hypothetical protein